jgi:hypothetical protein
MAERSHNRVEPRGLGTLLVIPGGLLSTDRHGGAAHPLSLSPRDRKKISPADFAHS